MQYFQGLLEIAVKVYIDRFFLIVSPNSHIVRTRFNLTYFLHLEWIIVFSVVKLDNVLSLS